MKCHGDLPKSVLSAHRRRSLANVEESQIAWSSESGFDINQVKMHPQLLEMAVQG